MDDLLCPACHHRDHDPGSCPECPRCELHVDEALAWVERIDPTSFASLGERRRFVAALQGFAWDDSTDDLGCYCEGSGASQNDEHDEGCREIRSLLAGGPN